MIVVPPGHSQPADPNRWNSRINHESGLPLPICLIRHVTERGRCSLRPRYGPEIKTRMTRHPFWSSVAIVVLLAASPLSSAGPPTIRPTSGYKVYWQEGDRFVEATEKVHKASIDLTIKGHHFNLRSSDGMEAAKSVLDKVTQQIIDDNRKLPQYGNKRLIEKSRRDKPSGRVITRTVELTIDSEKKVAAAERAEQERQEAAAIKQRKAAEQAEKERQQRETAQQKQREAAEKTKKDAAEREQQSKDRAQREKQARETVEREKQPRKESTKAEPSTAVVPVARPLGVTILPTGSDQGSRCNACLQSVNAYATDRQLILNCKVDGSLWALESGSCPIVITVLNKQGVSLEHFVTQEKYIADRMLQSANSQPADQPIPLKSSWNRLTYVLGQRTLQEAATVEIGFATP